MSDRITPLTAPRGMHDLLPAQCEQQEYLERVLCELASNYGFRPIRTPLAEQIDLFKRVGETTDIVEKEMYLLMQEGKQQLALRPENTASCVRALLQHQLATPQKLYYHGPMFRYERPQAGRYRQFYQFGVECFSQPAIDGFDHYIDLELLQLCQAIWQRLGLAPQLEINFLGTRAERSAYNKQLVAFLTTHYCQLDSDSQRRLGVNPLRILDTKNSQTQQLLDNAPQIHDCFGEASRRNFRTICAGLDALGIAYTHNCRLVRGLDYYNNLVFEWVSSDLGAQATLCAGGRYDRLCSDVGASHPIAGAGFALGIERLMLVLADSGKLPKSSAIDIALVSDATPVDMLVELAQIRAQLPGWRIDIASGKHIGKQLAKAAKSDAMVALIIGQNERLQQHVAIKYLREERPQHTVLMNTLAAHFTPYRPNGQTRS